MVVVMKKVLLFLVSLIALSTSGTLLYNYVTTYSAFTDVASKQEVTVPQYIINSSDKDVHYSVFYKSTCSACKEWSGEIVMALSSLPEGTVSYYESSKGVPRNIRSAFSSIDFDTIHMPYVVRSQRTSEGTLVVTWAERVNTEETLNKLKSFYNSK